MVKRLGYRFLQAFGYRGEQINNYYTQSICGIWLIYIGFIIMIASGLGGERFIQPIIFGAGFFLGYLLIWCFPFLTRKLATGKPTDFQNRMDNFGLMINIVLCSLCGLLIGTSDLRLLWLVIFIIVGLHFIPFYFSQGKWLVYLALLTILNAILGLVFYNIPFIIFGLLDGFIKLTIGVIMLFFLKNEVKAS